ncbi:MAG: hypothetical protein JST86_03865 [Bacteroidetes bacterium]|nr:hypothetical protein [Bacteroidota bacterium]
MIRKFVLPAITAALLWSCGSGTKKEPVTDTEVATTFIRAVLDNDFTTAEKYLLADTLNTQYFQTFKRQYQGKPQTELDAYKKADITIYEIKPTNDSLHIVTYANSYKSKDTVGLKLVWKGSKWLVDFKYTADKQQQ